MKQMCLPFFMHYAMDANKLCSIAKDVRQKRIDYLNKIKKGYITRCYDLIVSAANEGKYRITLNESSGIGNPRDFDSVAIETMIPGIEVSWNKKDSSYTFCWNFDTDSDMDS